MLWRQDLFLPDVNVISHDNIYSIYKRIFCSFSNAHTAIKCKLNIRVAGLFNTFQLSNFYTTNMDNSLLEIAIVQIYH